MSFKDMLQHDIENVFLNPNEFAERCKIEYDGTVYENISALFIDLTEDSRTQLRSDHAEGLFRVTAVLYCSSKALGGIFPEKKGKIRIAQGKGRSRLFLIAKSTCPAGMIRLELEVIGE